MSNWLPEREGRGGERGKGKDRAGRRREEDEVVSRAFAPKETTVLLQ